MRIARCSRHVVGLIQHVPSACTAATTASVVASSSPKRTRTWLRATSLRISMSSSAPRISAKRRAHAQQRSTISATPSRPSERSAA